MDIYCAFLRGVNIKGTAMKMADAVSVFEKEGMQNVSSILATGNIIFSSPEERVQLKIKLEKALTEFFQFKVFLFLKSKEEIKTIYEQLPFLSNSNYHIYSFVGVEDIGKILENEFLQSNKSEGEEGKLVDGHFYWKVKKGFTLESEFGKILSKKSLKEMFTSRNINTFEKVLKKMHQ